MLMDAQVVEVRIDPSGLRALLGVPSGASGIVIFAQGALAAFGGVKPLIIVEGAGYLFEQTGTMEEVVRHATDWFLDHRNRPSQGS